MIGRLVSLSVRHRRFVLIVCGLLALLGLRQISKLQLDALPDVTGNLVVVLTGAPGFSPEEVELRVTRPLERVLGAMPGLVQERSLSRYGISSITLEFEENIEIYRARQMVQERLNEAQGALPPNVEAPQLGPITGGLGEIYHLALSAPHRSVAELYEMAEYEMAPILRTVSGVVEVNTWGGKRRTFDVVVDPARMAIHNVTLPDVAGALESSLASVPGGALDEQRGQSYLRASFLPTEAAELSSVALRDGLLLGDVAETVTGHAFRTGSATKNGEGETVYVMVQMLRGANALAVLDGVKARMADVRSVLPSDVRLDVIYDRGVLVRRTLRTVFTNLLEGGLLVFLVLFLTLGSLRAGLIVAVSIPLSMLGAVVGMTVLGVPGNLMSLGAIDFGLLVDGAVVMVESFFLCMEREQDASETMFESRGRAVARPVFYSVLIILLVYLPILTLSGVDGKMFKPMAITVILALATSILLVLTVVPAASAAFLRLSDVPKREPWLVRQIRRFYDPVLRRAVAGPRVTLAFAVALLAIGGLALSAVQTTFIPQLEEGDLVVQTTRRADISLDEAIEDGSRMERILIDRFPEVKQIVSRIGSPAVATDIMGLEQADVFVTLTAPSKWREGMTKPALVDEMSVVLAESDPENEAGFTQPIQMRLNELVGGETTDVALSIFGSDLEVLRAQAERAAELLKATAGVVDVRIIAPPEVKTLEVKPRLGMLAHYGLAPRLLFDTVASLREGLVVGETYVGRVTVPVRIKVRGPHDAASLAGTRIVGKNGTSIALGNLADIRSVLGPAMVSHENGQRRIVVGFNVRGQGLGTTVDAAQARLGRELVLPTGYRPEWGGQYAVYQAAKARMLIVAPASLVLIFGLLLWLFRRVQPALVLLLNVPFAFVGGIALLWLRGIPLSISAGIGFIALSGIAVLNGVVLMNGLLARDSVGESTEDAVIAAASERMRPVFMTALVAALGFVPMMLATGVGAEVQRPLATVVVGGLVTSTVLTLLILPSLHAWMRRAWGR